LLALQLALGIIISIRVRRLGLYAKFVLLMIVGSVALFAWITSVPDGFQQIADILLLITIDIVLLLTVGTVLLCVDYSAS
jgi:hypothetical protein